MANTPQRTAHELREVLDHLAKSAYHARESWTHAEAALEASKESCPEHYNSLAYLMVGSHESFETLEEAADTIAAPLLADYVPTGKPLPAPEK